jgi:4'-phosphopantetheinyl transferase
MMSFSVTANTAFQPPRRGIHIWTFPNHAPSDVAKVFERYLAADELQRAGRFRFEDLRASFIAVHGALRCVLGRYLGVPPGSIGFTYGPKGKPALAGGSLEFNLSHSGKLAAMAVTSGGAVGVDVEEMRPLDDLELVAQRFFCPEEAAEVLSLPKAEQTAAFYRCWTRKEAYVKAIGSGLSVPLDAFQVSVVPGEPAHLIHIEEDRAAARAWMLHDLDLAPGYAAALAYRGDPKPLSFFSSADLRELVRPA